MAKDTISILDGSTFLVSDLRGDVEASPDQLARYGFRAEAARIALATLEAATYFRYRLPEVFAGYRRGRTGFPVEYPTASSPQAWATGTPLLLLRVLLGLEPEGDALTTDPHLPDGIERVTLEGIPGRWGTSDAAGTQLEEALA